LLAQILLRKLLSVDFSECRGCQICELTCSFAKLRIFAPSLALIRVVHEYPATERPIVCYQCNDAPCARVCPANAIARAETGALVVSEAACTGCRLCVDACPWGLIKTNPSSGIAMKCDLCGGNPECVTLCPPKALKFESPTRTVENVTNRPTGEKV